ncbi:hypothetical protein ACJIZ3_000345 [Penstemon smallii]|uniref:Amino acid transporter transmembrane domain-containing protein n=1 Tax=Penstemon smallii TaxID=265156 RepID=A0ABD3R4G9_9LAMI
MCSTDLFTFELNRAIERSSCLHTKGHESPCRVSSNPYMIAFGVVEIISGSSMVAFNCYCSNVLYLFHYCFKNGMIKGSYTGISIGTVTKTQKIWRTFQALGDIAFAYSYSLILIEIQGLSHSPRPDSFTFYLRLLFFNLKATTIRY